MGHHSQENPRCSVSIHPVHVPTHGNSRLWVGVGATALLVRSPATSVTWTWRVVPGIAGERGGKQETKPVTSRGRPSVTPEGTTQGRAAAEGCEGPAYGHLYCALQEYVTWRGSLRGVPVEGDCWVRS